MEQSKTNKPLHDIRIFGATIWGLRQLKRPWINICKQIDIPMSTAKRYYAQYMELIKDEPRIRDSMAQATQEIANLVDPSVKKYKQLIDATHKSPAMEGHALSAARDVLKTHNIVKDKHIVEFPSSRLSDDELDAEYRELVSRRRTASGSEQVGAETPPE